MFKKKNSPALGLFNMYIMCILVFLQRSVFFFFLLGKDLAGCIMRKSVMFVWVGCGYYRGKNTCIAMLPFPLCRPPSNVTPTDGFKFLFSSPKYHSNRVLLHDRQSTTRSPSLTALLQLCISD